VGGRPSGSPPYGSTTLSMEVQVSEHVYKTIELTGSSANGIEAAVHNAVDKAGRTIRQMRWFEVTDTRGHLEDGRIAHWQVTVKIGFTLE
jgi:dodecin